MVRLYNRNSQPITLDHIAQDITSLGCDFINGECTRDEFLKWLIELTDNAKAIVGYEEPHYENPNAGKLAQADTQLVKDCTDLADQYTGQTC